MGQFQEEARQQAQARADAETERAEVEVRRVRQTRWALAGLSLLLLLLVGAIGLTFQARQDVQNNAATAEANALTAQAAEAMAQAESTRRSALRKQLLPARRTQWSNISGLTNGLLKQNSKLRSQSHAS